MTGTKRVKHQRTFLICSIWSNLNTVFIRLNAVAFIKFFMIWVPCLFEGNLPLKSILNFLANCLSATSFPGNFLHHHHHCCMLEKSPGNDVGFFYIGSLGETAHANCAQVELQFRQILASSSNHSFKYLSKSESVIPDFPLLFSVWL